MTYAYDSKFFLKNLVSVKKLLDIFSCYSKHSGRKSNFSKCEIASIGFLKGNDVTMCGIKCVNLQVNTIKILRNLLTREKNSEPQYQTFKTFSKNGA